MLGWGMTDRRAKPASVSDAMSRKIGTAFFTILVLAAVPAAALETHSIAREAAWGCRDKTELFNLLWLGLSASFDNKLATAIAEGRCVLFKAGESIEIVEPAGHGIVQVQRGGAAPVAYWTSARNVK